ncbi:hypothetical protein [Roseateles sp.]|uniref:hypothetical protein n=1 Tax=Roseateles sp. TaxID=1971397 RepID=UPI0031D16CA7
MPKLLRVLNILQLALFALVIVLNLAFARPSTSSDVFTVLCLLPAGVALIAARSDSKRLASWAALVLNTLWALLCGYMVVKLLMWAPSRWVVLAIVPMLLIALWNLAIAWIRLFPADEAARESAA